METIREHELFSKKDRLCVAVSGGKDSQVLMHLLHANGYNVAGLLIDEGIAGYRQPTLQNMVDFCEQRNIPLTVVTFNEDVGTTLDAVATKLNAPPCTACGAWRRKLLNKHARGFDYVVTGHNLDDESQAFMMNILSGRLEQSLRIGIKTKGNGFVRRVKPLYFLSEKDIRLYTLFKGFDIQEDDCPYAKQSFRWMVRDSLNDIEAEHPGAKLAIVRRFAGLQLDAPPADRHACSRCGQPSMRDICVACSLQDKFVNNPSLKIIGR